MGGRIGMVAVTTALLAACASDNPTAHVVGTLLPDESCEVGANSTFLLAGGYDASPGFDNQCANSYYMNLLVNSYLINRGQPRGVQPTVMADPNVLKVTRAEIELLNADDSRIPFGAFPNPFSVTTSGVIPSTLGVDPGSGIVLVEVIPGFYSTQAEFQSLATRRATIVAAVTLFGETTGGVSVELSEYRFQIRLCNGCLTLCRAALTDAELDQATEGVCADNAGADGRYCIQRRCM